MHSRALTPFEIAEARRVFQSSLDMSAIRVFEGAAWPNAISRLHAWFRGSTPPQDNAVTLGNAIFFPRCIKTGGDGLSPSLTDLGWLMHELTHAWQFQHEGVIYLFQACYVQIRQGNKAYDYGGESGLTDAQRMGMSLLDFNREQQADIVRHYYLRLRQDLDLSPWRPFVQQLHDSRRAA